MGYLDAPRGTGLPALVERWFGTVAGKVSALADIVRSLNEPEVAVAPGNLGMTVENVVCYVGSGGHTIMLPPANAIAGRRSRLRAIYNNSPVTGSAPAAALSVVAATAVPGGVLLVPSGTDTINNATFMLLMPGSMTTIISDGLNSWRAQSPQLNDTISPFFATIATVDPAAGVGAGKFAARIDSIFRASANVGAGRSTAAFQLDYAMDAQGHTMASTWRGYRQVGTETDLGGGTHVPVTIQTGSTVIYQLDADGTIRYGKASVANGGGAAPTLGTIGGSGPATAGQAAWMKVFVDGVATYIPVWR